MVGWRMDGAGEGGLEGDIAQVFTDTHREQHLTFRQRTKHRNTSRHRQLTTHARGNGSHNVRRPVLVFVCVGCVWYHRGHPQASGGHPWGGFSLCSYKCTGPEAWCGESQADGQVLGECVFSGALVSDGPHGEDAEGAMGRDLRWRTSTRATPARRHGGDGAEREGDGTYLMFHDDDMLCLEYPRVG